MRLKSIVSLLLVPIIYYTNQLSRGNNEAILLAILSWRFTRERTSEGTVWWARDQTGCRGCAGSSLRPLWSRGDFLLSLEALRRDATLGTAWVVLLEAVRDTPQDKAQPPATLRQQHPRPRRALSD